MCGCSLLLSLSPDPDQMYGKKSVHWRGYQVVYPLPMHNEFRLPVRQRYFWTENW